MREIKLATTEIEIGRCFALMSQLRSQLTENTFLETIKHLQQGGYQLACLLDENQIKSLAGFRISNNLFMGKHLYIEALVNDESQHSKGYGEALLNCMRYFAKEKIVIICISILEHIGIRRISFIFNKVLT